MNVCIIMPNVFPVPATKGGATEMIITNLLNENEKLGLMNFTCISVYDEKAEKLSRNYKYSKCIYIKQKRANNDLTFEMEDTFFKNYMDEIYAQIKDKEFDFYIVEGGDISGYEYLLKHFPKEKCFVHIHGNGLGDNKVNDNIYEKFIAISNYTKKLITEDGIIKPEKVELLYNAIKVSDFDKKITDQEKVELRKKYNIEEDDVVILYSGRTIEQKGIKQLIQSFINLKNINKSKLLIVGSSNYAEKVKTEFDYEIEKLVEKVPDKIKITGYIDNKELYKMHNISDIAVVPSMWEELFGLVVIEAMSSGLPLVVTKSGGIPEIVDKTCAYILDKDESLIQNLTEKLDYLIENPDIRHKMGKCGRERVTKFDMDQYLYNFYELMKRNLK